jgi:hypothetical protein
MEGERGRKEGGGIGKGQAQSIDSIERWEHLTQTACGNCHSTYDRLMKRGIKMPNWTDDRAAIWFPAWVVEARAALDQFKAQRGPPKTPDAVMQFYQQILLPMYLRYLYAKW